MARTIPAAIKATVEADVNAPIVLHEMHLDSGIRRYAENYSSDVVFPIGGNAYTAMAIMRGQAKTDLRANVSSMKVMLSNIDREFSALVVDNREEFRDRKYIIKRVYQGNLGNASYYIPLFAGKMDMPKVTQDWFQLTIKNDLFPRTKLCPKRRFFSTCQWIFGDSNCDPNDTIEKDYTGEVSNVDEPNSSKFYMKFTPHNSVIASDVILKGGYITFTTGDNTGSKRRINFATYTEGSSYDLYIKLFGSFQYNVKPSDKFDIINGCDKSKANCMEHNNMANFGGFLFAIEDWIGSQAIRNQ